jgi:hypothetical protein
MQARIVHKDVNAAPTLGNFRTSIRYGRRIGYIYDKAHRIVSNCPGFIKNILPASEKGNSIPIARGELGDREAKASRCASNYPSPRFTLWLFSHASPA